MFIFRLCIDTRIYGGTYPYMHSLCYPWRVNVVQHKIFVNYFFH